MADCKKLNAIEISNLQKNYNGFSALKGVDLAIKEGDFFGLLGPNGAGKTTLINSIVGLVKPSHGQVIVMGHNNQKESLKAKQFLGLASQEINIHQYFPIEKVLEFQGGFYGLSIKEAKARAQELLKRFDLWEKRKMGRFKLSGGMQRRLMIARALMGNPKILILDEPTAGIDVELRHTLWQLLKKFNQDGMTILLTTHYIEEAELLCKRVAIIHHGKILACDSPKNLIEQKLPKEKQNAHPFIRPGTLEGVFVSLTGTRISEGGEGR